MKKNILHGFLVGFATIILATSSAWATTYTSVAPGDFTNGATWGASLTDADFQNGTNSFIVKHAVTLGDSIKAVDLTVESGGHLTFGRDAETFKCATVTGTFLVKTGGEVDVADLAGTRILQIGSRFENQGTVNFRRKTNKVVNVVFVGATAKTVKNSGTAIFSNFEVAGGTVTAESDLDVDGALTIGASATQFTLASHTLYLAGNFTKNATSKTAFDYANGKIVFEGTVQSVSGASDNNWFNDIEVSGGGFLVISCRFYCVGNFLVTSNSTVSSSASLRFYGNFTVESGSRYDSNTEYTCFFRGYDADGEPTGLVGSDQTITLGGDVTFAGVSCRSKSATVGTKTFIGSINSTAELRAHGKAKIVDDAATYHHQFSGAKAEGGIELQSPMTIIGGTLRYSDSSYGDITLGGGDITIRTGTIYVKAGDTFKPEGNVTVETGAFVLNGTYDNEEDISAKMIGKSGKSFVVADGAAFYLKGYSDHYPTGFSTIELGDNSTTYYNSNFNQEIHPTTYGNLCLQYKNKTFTGSTNIARTFYVYSGTNDEIHVNMGDFEHTIGTNITDNPDVNGRSSIKSTGKVIMNGNRAQTIYNRTGGDYEFYDLIFTSSDPQNSQTKTIIGDITVKGELKLRNASTNELLFLALDIDNYVITGNKEDSHNVLDLGENTRIKVSGANNLSETAASFNDVILDPNSLVVFDATDVAQTIPTLTYGNIYLYGSTVKRLAGSTTIKGWINVNGGTPILTIDEGVELYIEGDWKLSSSYLNINPNSTIILSGAGNQEIVGTKFPNLEVRGNGVKTLKGTLTIEGDLDVFSGCEFNADNRTINLYGDFRNFDGGGGIYHQNYGRLNLNGSRHIQNVYCNDTVNTRFYNVYIEKAANDTVRFQNDVFVGNNMMTTTNKGHLDIYDHRLIIGGDFYLYKGCKFVHKQGASLHFTSSDAEQLIRNYNTENTYPTMHFSGSAVKRPYDNAFDINGDVIIDHDAIVTSSIKLMVSGNWRNSGTFNHSSEVIFDRCAAVDGDGNQYISGSAFYNVTFAGDGSKMLKGMINVSGQLKIDSLSTLDVSPDGGSTYNDIKVGGTWKNNIWSPGRTSTGRFIAREGTVTFTGNSSYIYSGDSIEANNVGREFKSFYNVVINCSDPTNYKGLYPIYKTKNSEKSEQNDLYVKHDFVINTGIFYVYWNTLFVGANLQNYGGTFSMNSHYVAASRLLLGGVNIDGTPYEFNPGEVNTIRQIEVVGGGKYNLMSDYVQFYLSSAEENKRLIHISNGELCLNGHSIMFNDGGDVLIEPGGTLNIDAGAELAIQSGRYIRNAGGNLKLVGKEGVPAKILTAATNKYYYIEQTAGKLYANNYCIEGTNGDGLNILGGSIDATDNLSNGMFSNSSGNALLTIGGDVIIPTGCKIENVSFNSSGTPGKNVKRTSGTVPITFKNYSGSLAGADYEVDTDANLIIWEEPTGFLWTGNAGDGKWHTAGNWSSNTVPGANDDAYLKYVSGKNNVKIEARAEIKSLTIAKDVNLKLEGPSEDVPCGLIVNNKLTMLKNSKLEQTADWDSLIIKGSWISSGNFVPNGQATIFDVQEGIQQVSVPVGQPLSAMVVKGSGSLTIAGKITVNDSIVIEKGGSLLGSNATINLKGNWINNGGIFDEGNSTVDFCGDDLSKTQTVNGGKFWIIQFTGKSNKIIASDLSVMRNFNINSDAKKVYAGTSNVYMIGRPSYWYNYTDDPGVFEQIGDGAVICSGSTVYFGKDAANANTKTMKFNNLVLQGTGSKCFYSPTLVTGTVEMVTGVDVVIGRYGSITGCEDEGVNNSAFISYGGALLIYGEDNFPHNITTMELIGGSVYYRDSIDQIVYPANYNGLVLRNEYKGSSGKNFSKRVTRKTLTDNISVAGTLNINDSLALLDVNNNTITLAGTISMANKGKQIIWGTNGTLIHIGGSWDVSANITDFCNVYKRGTGYLYASSDWTVTGDMEFDPETRFYMRGNKITGLPEKHFKMSVNCQLHSSVEKVRGVAFPQGFGSYLLDESTTTYLEASADQTVFTNVNYGALYLSTSVARTVDFDGDLKVRGNFTNAQDATIVDAGENEFYLWGASNDIRNYRTDTTLYLMADGDQKIATGGNIAEMNLKNIELLGSGVKEIDDTKVNISGTVKVGSGTSFSCNDAVVFRGDSILNEGTFRHYGSSFTFDGDTTHYIFMGADNIFNGIIITDNDTVVVRENGITLNTGTFSLGKKARFEMGNFTHNLASPKIELADNCLWDTKDATLVFDRNTTQNLPSITCANIQFSNAGSKILDGDLHVGNLTIDEGVTFSVGSSADAAKTVYVKGDWICNGSFTSQTDTVYFDSQSAGERILKANNQTFNVVKFNNYTNNECTYKLSDQMTLKDGMTIGNNATFHLNKNILVVGNDDANATEAPFVPDGEYLDVLAGGELYIDGGASLQFNHQDDNTHLRVWGTLSIVGSPDANAVISRSAGSDNRGTEIDIFDYGKVAAEYYQIQYVAPTGFNIHRLATIDATHNLSNGIWSNMYTSASYTRPKDKTTVVDTFVYLIINAEVVANPIIKGLSFNHGGSPTIGAHFNILRDSTLETIIDLSQGTVNGGIGTQYYEMYAFPKGYKAGRLPCQHKIKWPDVKEVVWTGLVSSNWFDPRNWLPQRVPSAEESARIPIAANAPIIFDNGAICNDLTIVNGSLTIDKDLSAPALNVQGSVDVQNGGIFAIMDDAVVDVTGDWSIASRGYFVPRNGTVRFLATGGSVTLSPRGSDFNNVSFVGGATYMLSGSTVNFNGDIDIENGTLWPATSNYVYNVKGDYNVGASGAFNNVETGYVVFNGTSQTVTNGKFNRVRFSNSGTKTVAGTFDATYNSSTRTNRTIIIEDNATLQASCPLTIKGNVLIDGNATFDDGNREHTFTGYYWEAPKNKGYAGSGKIVFSGNHAQYIWGGRFHDVDMTLNTKYISGDTKLTGNLTLNGCSLDMQTYHIDGDGTFEMTGTKTIYVYTRGENNYPTFANYEVTGTNCYSYYNGPMDQIIRGGDNVKYGYLYMTSNTTKKLEGEIRVLKNLNIAENGGTLNAAGKTIYLAGHWYNQYNGRFIHGGGMVIFNGTAGTQYAYLGVSVENPFYDIVVEKTGTQQFAGYYVDLTLDGTLLVTGGKMNCFGGYRVKVAGDLQVIAPGSINQSGCYELNRPSGTCTIETAGSILNDLVINGGDDGTKFVPSDDLTVYGNFTLQRGLFDQEGRVVTLGNSLDNSLIYGYYRVGKGGTLRIGDASSFVVKAGGTFEAVGEKSSYAQITNNSGRYYFTVEGGTIMAEYYSFSYLAKQGIIISKDAEIDYDANFSNGVFSNVVSAGVCLDIRNDQYLVGDDRIENVSFPSNPGGGAVNIKKTENPEGNITMYNASGLLSGELYENDPYNIVEWEGDVEYVWTAGANSTDWFDPLNWRAEINKVPLDPQPGTIPDENNSVIIATTTTGFNKYPIIDRDSVMVKKLTIDKLATLTINLANPDPAADLHRALIVKSDVIVNGILNMTSQRDTLQLHGNWVIGTSGKLVAGLGTVEMVGVGVKAIQNKTMSFNNLVIDNTGIVQSQSALKVGGDFEIKSGTFDVGSYDVTLCGNFKNAGTFMPQSRTLIFDALAGIVHTIDPGTSIYNNVQFKSGEYSLENNELNVNHNIELDGGMLIVEDNTINMGDGSGVDNLNISGTLSLVDNGQLKMSDNAFINVNSGGTISLIGSKNNEAIVTSQTLTGTYAFNVSGTIAADYYKIEQLNADGLHLKPGSAIDGTNNLSNGQYSSGTRGGCYMWLENDLSGADVVEQIRNVYFNAGATKNVRRDKSTAVGKIEMHDAVGVLASFYFEDEDPVSAIDGAVIWTYSGEVRYWVGNKNLEGDDDVTDEYGRLWSNVKNWDNGAGVPALPTAETRVFIPAVDHDKYPVIDASSGDATVKGIDVYAGASMEIKDGCNLSVTDPDLGLSIGENATFKASDGVSESVITINGQFANAGNFVHGGSSKVVWASSSNRYISMNDCSFFDFEVQNAGTSVITFSVEPGKSLVIENNFTITSGKVNCNGGKLDVGGDFTKVGGSFIHGGGTVRLNGNKEQTISSNETLVFNNLELIGSNLKNINVDIDVEGDIVIGTDVKAMDDVDITCYGNWTRPASGSQSNNFVGGSGAVIFKGSKAQVINKPETFTNLTLNNSTLMAFSTSYSQTISGELTLTHGILKGNAEKPIILTKNATVTGGGPNSYINGTVEKEGSGDFLFPIGGNDRYAPVEIFDLSDLTDKYQIGYHSDKPDNQSNLDFDVNMISTKEYWTLKRNAGSEMPKVKLYWYDRDFSELKDLDVLSVVLYTEGKWTRQIVRPATDELEEVGALEGYELNFGRGYIQTQVPIAADGKITFGFTYPTIVWADADNTTEVFAEKNNWVNGKYSPNETVNVRIVPVEDGRKTPIVTADGKCFDMTIVDGGRLEVASGKSLTVNGNAKIEGELVLDEGASITFLKDVTSAVTGKVKAAEGSNVFIHSDAPQSFAMDSCYNLILKVEKEKSKRIVKTLASDIKIGGTITVSHNAKFEAGNNKVHLGGDFVVDRDGDFDSGTSTLILDGNKQQLLSITPTRSLKHLTVNNTCTTVPQIDLGTGIKVTGDLNLVKGKLHSTSTSRLTLTSSASSTPGNTESYVIGEMSKEGSGEFVFPIGSERGLAQLGVSGMGKIAYLVAEYKTAKPSSVGNLDEANVAKVSHLESWHISNKDDIKADLTLYWNDAEYSEINNPNELLVAVLSGGKWYSFGCGGSGGTGGEGGCGWVKSSTQITIKKSSSSSSSMRAEATRRTLNSIPHILAETGGTDVTFGTKQPAINPLPIELLSFDAVAADNNADVKLAWSTASEHNNAFFTIEHMFDGESEMVDTIAAQGGAGVGADYSYLHINLPAGTHYYRLLQTDFDGQTTVASEWSAVVLENTERPELAASVAPNPGKCQNIKISVSGIAGSKLRYVVADMSGQSLIDRTISTDGMSSFQIDASDWNLQPAMYLVKVFTDNGQTVSKFVVE